MKARFGTASGTGIELNVGCGVAQCQVEVANNIIARAAPALDLLDQVEASVRRRRPA